MKAVQQAGKTASAYLQLCYALAIWRSNVRHQGRTHHLFLLSRQKPSLNGSSSRQNVLDGLLRLADINDQQPLNDAVSRTGHFCLLILIC